MTYRDRINYIEQYIDHLLDEKTVNILTISGGKDSTALYLLALAFNIPFLPVFANTGNEHQWTLDYVRSLHLKTNGPQVLEVMTSYDDRLAQKRAKIITSDIDPSEKQKRFQALLPTGNPMFDGAIHGRSFPFRLGRYCTRELKIEPVNEQIILPHLEKGYKIVKWTGMRREESQARKELPVWVPENLETHIVHKFSPLAEWKVEDVWSIHSEYWIEPNPLYHLGHTRVGCYPCIYSTKDQLQIIQHHHPEHIDRLEKWEDDLNTRFDATNRTFLDVNDTGWKKGEPVDYRVHGIRAKIKHVFNRKRSLKDFKVKKELTADEASECDEWGVCE